MRPNPAPPQPEQLERQLEHARRRIAKLTRERDLLLFALLNDGPLAADALLSLLPRAGK